jgi:hypothetical protein
VKLSGQKERRKALFWFFLCFTFFEYVTVDLSGIRHDLAGKAKHGRIFHQPVNGGDCLGLAAEEPVPALEAVFAVTIMERSG